MEVYPASGASAEEPIGDADLAKQWMQTPRGAFESYVATPVEVDESLPLRVPQGALPADWHRSATRSRTRAIEDAWVERGSSATLEVPRRIVPEEAAYLLHSDHPDFQKIRIGRPRAFRLDSSPWS